MKFSFIILLSDPNDFEGGGTYYDEEKLLISNKYIGNIRIQKKKIYVYSCKINATSEFGLDDKENAYNFINII